MIPRLALSLFAAVLTFVLSPQVLPGTPGSAPALATIVFQTDMYGSENVPPVKTSAWGFFRFFFSDDKTVAEVTVDVKGLSNSLVTGADIHRGLPGENGPVVKHLSDGNFIVTSARVRFSTADLDEMAAGNYYISLKSKEFPRGELRGQIVLPAGFWRAPAPVVPAHVEEEPYDEPAPPAYEEPPAFSTVPNPPAPPPFLSPLTPAYVPVIIPVRPVFAPPPGLQPAVPFTNTFPSGFVPVPSSYDPLQQGAPGQAMYPSGGY